MQFVIVSTSPADGLWPDQQGGDGDGGSVTGPFATASEARSYLAEHRASWYREPTILPMFVGAWREPQQPVMAWDVCDQCATLRASWSAETARKLSNLAHPQGQPEHQFEEVR